MLRVVGPVADDFGATQRALLSALPAEVSHPHTPHVTLRGFAEPEGREEVEDFLREWATAQHLISLTSEALDTFPSPWQIVIVRLARTESLVSAYSSLSAALAPTSFTRVGELSPEEWIFHLSVVYGGRLDPRAWTEAERIAHERRHPVATEIATQAEFVWYADGAEHRELIPLGR
ncbi:2'-5' RNA ligase family protein [Microbacterium sp. NIBRBAC000506063]|uniref:2'-5' RNA ligase family protein n=1 Tax=Microbacterium sp. NIBRBAC000506063 TaxID=2734618 RepID=UPI001CB6E22F|nr:2'-5' RNA ligase family protein [Microbacterium sp. NIBRBAC000506063]